MIIKIDTNLLNEQIRLIDVCADNASSEEEQELLDGVVNLLSEISSVADNLSEIYFEKINESYTAFIYEDNGYLLEDESMYDNKQEAIEFAKARNWDEVVNDNTGEIVWRREQE